MEAWMLRGTEQRCEPQLPGPAGGLSPGILLGVRLPPEWPVVWESGDGGPALETKATRALPSCQPRALALSGHD